MPIYFVTIAASDDNGSATKKRLIDAKNAARAVMHATKAHVECRKATTDDLLECGAADIKVEKAADE